MNRYLNMLARAILRRVDDTGPRQMVQIEATKGELIDGVPRFQNYGVTSNPPVAGSDAMVAFLGGSREQGVVIAMENRQFRLTGLEAGEVAIHDDLGNVVLLGREELSVTAVTRARVIAPSIELVGDTNVVGRFTVNGVNVGDDHTHTNNGAGVPVR